MPRIGLNQRAKMYENVLIAISGECTKLGIRRKDLEKKIGMKSSTYTNRLHHPELFTLSELCSISCALNTTVPNLLSGRISGTEV